MFVGHQAARLVLVEHLDVDGELVDPEVAQLLKVEQAVDGHHHDVDVDVRELGEHTPIDVAQVGNVAVPRGSTGDEQVTGRLQGILEGAAHGADQEIERFREIRILIRDVAKLARHGAAANRSEPSPIAMSEHEIIPGSAPRGRLAVVNGRHPDGDRAGQPLARKDEFVVDYRQGQRRAINEVGVVRRGGRIHPHMVVQPQYQPRS